MKQDPWAVALSTAKVVPQTVSAAPVASTQASGGEEDFGAPLRDPHPKEFDPPQPYSGNADSWLSWSASFKEYLCIRDPRWGKLLAAVERLQGVQVTETHEKGWDRELRLGGIEKFKQILHMYFKQHMKGAVRSEVIDTCGIPRALDAWRILADRGCSQRPEALHAKLAKIIAPKKAVTTKEVERAIGEWERDIEVYRQAKPSYVMEADQQRMLLMQLCPPHLQSYLRMQRDVCEDYYRMKTAIHDWLGFPENQTKGGKLATCEQVLEEGEATDEQEVELDEVTKHSLMEADSTGQLLALVRKELKKSKGKGKGKSQKSKRTCYECGSEDHLADKCPIRTARVLAGGPERLDDPMGKGSKKGAGKSGGKGKGKDSGKQGGEGVGVWTKEGDHGGSWLPSRAQLKGSQGGLPYPSTHQYKHPWHPGGKGGANWMGASEVPEQAPYPGFIYPLSCLSQVKTPAAAPRLACASAPEEVQLEQRSWLEVARKRKPAADACQQNRFAPLREEGLTGAVQKSVPMRPAAKTKKTIIGKISHSCKDKCCHSEADYAVCGVRGAVAAPADEPMPGETPTAGQLRRGRWRSKCPRLATFIERRAQQLRRCESDEWETIETILDSGATVTVIPPHMARAYDVTPGEASKAGVRYEIANGEEIPNLGEKNMYVMTEEGSWREFKAQVAEVSKALQSVRSLVKAGHLVVFGDGEDGCNHYVLNKFSGEINRVNDDGINYLMKLHIAPRAASPFGGPAAAR